MPNKAAFMVGLEKLEFRDIPVPQPKETEVLVKLEYVGICGSDTHYFEKGRIGDFVIEGDFILGHECAGTVVETGKNVSLLKKGDRVALEPGITCGECEFCKTGNYNLCPDVVFLATPPHHGCFMEYIAFPQNMVFKLPDRVSSKEGALIEPLAVGMEAARQGSVTLGSSVIILGAGCIGLTALLASKAHGATDITVVDVLEARLRKAKELGAKHVINASKEDTVKEYLELTGGAGADVVMETAGALPTMQQTPFLVKRGGTIVIVGMPPQDEFPFNFGKLMGNVAQIKTVFRYKNLYQKAVNALEDGLIDISGIITHEYPFEKLEEAFEVNIHNQGDMVKTVVRIG